MHDDLSRYLSEITHIRQFTTSSEQRFNEYRDTQVVAIGSGLLLDVWTTAARRSGLRHIRLLPTENESDLAGLDGAGAVVYLSDNPDHSLARHLDHWYRKIPLVFGVLHGDRIWITQQWESLERRLGPAGATHQLTKPAAALAANQVAATCFRLLTGIEQPADRPSAVEIDMTTLVHQSHNLIPHPQVTEAGPERQWEFEAKIEKLRNHPRLTDDDIIRSAGACLSKRIGVIRGISERFTGPLYVTQVTLASQDGLLDTVHASGLVPEQVRATAMRQAFERYSASTVDRRRSEFLWAQDLLDGEVRPIRTAAVFPWLYGTAVRSGVGSGRDWSEAVTNGLLALCNEQAVADALNGTDRSFREVDLSTVDPEMQGYLHDPVEVYDITGKLTVPTFAFCQNGRTIAYTTALNPSDAITDGLRLTLQAQQARDTCYPESAPPPVRTLPKRQRGTIRQFLRPAVHRDELLDVLAAAKVHPVVVPLDHDPHVSALFPFVVRVIAT